MSPKNKIYRAENRHALEKWLQARCSYAKDIFDDPGYSNFYQSYFTHLFDDGTYTRGDIDCAINLGFYEYVYDPGLSQEDEDLLSYVDYIPSNRSTDEIERMVEAYPESDQDRAYSILSRECILIPPGTNQSNANYLYKNIAKCITDGENFRIPYVGSRTNVFNSNYKRAKFDLSKLDIYNFIYSVSTIDHTIRKMSNILHIDDILNYHPSMNKLTYAQETSGSDEASTGEPLRHRLTKYQTNELHRISKTIDSLYNEIVRYNSYIKRIWNDVFIPFLNSEDCMTLKYLSTNDYWMFEEFMQEQPLYVIMLSSMRNLRDREAYIYAGRQSVKV